jgi:predicted ATPase
VREVIGRRLGRLSEATSRVLGLAAVIGRQFDVALLATIAETSEDAVLDALEEATAAALVTEVRAAASDRRPGAGGGGGLCGVICAVVRHARCVP